MGTILLFIAMVFTGLGLAWYTCNEDHSGFTWVAAFVVGFFFAWIIWIGLVLIGFGWILKAILTRFQ